MSVEDVLYHHDLTSEIDSFFGEIREGFERVIKSTRTIESDFEKIVSSIQHARELSASVDRASQDPSLAVGAASDALGNYHNLYHQAHGSISEIKKSKKHTDGTDDFLSRIWEKYEDLLHKLVMNAVSTVKKYAQVLGIKNFSITVSSLPPSISATFEF